MATKTAPLPEVETHGIITVGGFNGRTSKLVSLTIGDITFLAMGANRKVYSPCGMCDNSSGYRSAYRHVQGGLCWHCSGSGIHHLYADTLEDAQKKARRTMARRATEARKEAIRLEALAAEKAEYRALNAGPIARVTAWLAERNLLAPEIEWDGTNEGYYAAEKAYREADEAFYDRKAASADSWLISAINEILGDIHMADAKKRPNAARWAKCEEFIRKYEGKEEARQAERDGSRYAGEQGEKITITGRCIAAFDADTADKFGRSIYRTGYIIKGTGEYAGITLKWVASGNPLFSLEEGEVTNKEITISGKIKALSEYKGIKQTVVFYCKVK